MMIKAPGVTKTCQSSDALLSQIDLYPTLCELLSLPLPEWLQGVSFLPVLNQTASEVRSELYGEINYHIACEPVRAVRTSRYKYIRHYLAEYPYQIPCHIDDSEPKEIFHQAGIFEQKLPMEELYDLVGDQQERNNLAECPEYQKQKEEMQNLLLGWQHKTGDPLAETGTVCLPAGAIASTPDSYSTKTQVILPECRQYLGALKEVLQNNIKS
jgi:arylsulfatase A-like enzyme